jgi:hypothetical protein
MNPNDHIVKDSSIWYDGVSSVLKRDTSLKIGIVREKKIMGDTKAVVYMVDVLERGRRYAIKCTVASRFNSPFNYEEYDLKAYGEVTAGIELQHTDMNNMAGDLVVVAYLSGDAREGIILGAIKHAGRPSKTESTKSVYFSEFNGLEQRIEETGAYITTFKGKPINSALLTIPGAPIPPPVYNELVAGTTMGFDAQGSWEINDNAKTLGTQSIKIDKTAGQIVITSGRLSIALNKTTSTMTISNDVTDISSKRSFAVNTLQFAVDAKASAKIKGTKIAIGNDGVELLDTICKLVDAIGNVVVTSPVGPCNPFLSSPQWVQVVALKNQIELGLKGSL